MNGDLLVKIMVDNSNLPQMKRVGDDLLFDLELKITDCLFGTKKEIKTIDGTSETVEIKPGSQFDDKVIFKDQGFFNPDDTKGSRGNFVVNFKIKVPNLEGLDKSKKLEIKNILDSAV